MHDSFSFGSAKIDETPPGLHVARYSGRSRRKEFIPHSTSRLCLREGQPPRRLARPHVYGGSSRGVREGHRRVTFVRGQPS